MVGGTAALSMSCPGTRRYKSSKARGAGKSATMERAKFHRSLQRTAKWGAGTGLVLAVGVLVYVFVTEGREAGDARDVVGILVAFVVGGAGMFVMGLIKTTPWSELREALGTGRALGYMLGCFALMCSVMAAALGFMGALGDGQP